MTTPTTLPLQPIPDHVSAGYWAGVESGQLMVQRCRSCSTWQHFPRALCGTCWSFDVGYEPTSGRGTIYSMVRVHHVTSPGYADRAPYSVAWVELPEQRGLRVLAVVTSPDSVPQIGDAVAVRFPPPPFLAPEFEVTAS